MLKQDFYSIFTDFPQALPEGMITASGLAERFLSKRCRAFGLQQETKVQRLTVPVQQMKTLKKTFPLQFHKAFHVALLRSKGYIRPVHMNEIETSEIYVVAPTELTHPKAWPEYVSI